MIQQCQNNANAATATAAYMSNGDSLVLLLGANGVPHGIEGGSSSSGCSNHSATELTTLSPPVNGIFDSSTTAIQNGYTTLPQLPQQQQSNKPDIYDVII